MMRVLSAAIFATLTATAAAEPVVVPSSGSVEETVERLEASIEAAGARVFTVVDFGSAIRRTGADVGEVKLVIFGDPRIGAQALGADLMAGLDLPGKVLVYETAAGSAMAYEQPARILAGRDIPADAPVFELMARTLDAITSAASE